MNGPSVLLLVAAAVGVTEPVRVADDGPAVFDWRPTRAKHGPRPLCFAYAPSLRAFACVGYVDEGQGRRQMVDVVGLGVRRPGMRRHALPKADANRWLAELGFSPGVPRGVRLPSGRWVGAGAATLRYEMVTRTGDASYENFGDVTVRCRDGREIPLGVRKRDLVLGDVAWAFWQPGSGVIAISVSGDDGGCDTIYRWVSTLVVDVRALCNGRDHGVIAGPVR